MTRILLLTLVIALSASAADVAIKSRAASRERQKRRHADFSLLSSVRCGTRPCRCARSVPLKHHRGLGQMSTIEQCPRWHSNSRDQVSSLLLKEEPRKFLLETPA